MNPVALSTADTSRRVVLLGGLTATVAAGVPPRVRSKTTHNDILSSPQAQT